MPGGDMVKVINNQSEFGQRYFYGNPEMTFWKATYRRHTNFAMEARKMTNRSATEAFGTEVTYTIPRDQSDLMYKVHLDADLPNPGSGFYVPFPGEKLIEYAEFRIGGTSISKRLTSDFLHCWNELTIPDGKKWAYRELVGNTNSGILTSGTVSITIPIPFWFTKNPGVAFPRNAVKNDDVSIVIKYQAASLMGRTTAQTASFSVTGTFDTAALYCTLIYLDEEERTRFQTARHEYLIEQVQTQTLTVSTNSPTVNFNFDHHVKELIWFATNSTVTGKNDFFNYTIGAGGENTGIVWNKVSNASSFTTIDNGFIWAADADGLASEHHLTDWNALVHSSNDGTTTATAGVTFAAHGTTGEDTKFISVPANNDLLGIDVGSINVGDFHLVTIRDVDTPANNTTTLAKVVQLIVANNTEVSNAGADGPVSGATLLTLDREDLSAKSLVIEYDVHVVPSEIRLAAGDILNLVKVSGSGSINEEQVYPTLTNRADVDISACQLKLDGSELFVDGAMNKRYFTQLQPMYHHTSVPWTPGIFVYSFALKPEEYQPSGTLDFSSIKTQQLTLTTSGTNYNNVTIFGINYNVLVIANGHANLVRNS